MKQRHIVLTLLVGLGLITFLDRICFSVAGSRIMGDLDFSVQEFGWVQSAFILSYGLFQIPLGIWADKHGQRLVIAVIVLWWSLFTGLTGLVSGLGAMLAVRFMFGMGEAGAYPAMAGTVARWFPKSERGLAQGFIWGASRAGGALSPLLVVPVQQAFGWRATFWLLGSVGLVWVTIWWLWYRNSPAEKPSVSAAERAEIECGQAPATKVVVPWGRFARNPQFWLILGMYFFYTWGPWFYFSWLHTYMVKGRGMEEEAMKIYSALPFLLGAISNVAGGIVSDRLTKKHGPRIGRRLVAALSLSGAAVCLLAGGLITDNLGAVLVIAFGFGVMDFALPCLWALCLDVGQKYAGSVTGAMNSAGNLGGFVCSVLFGYIAAAYGYNAPLLGIAGIMGVSVFLLTRIDPTRALAPDEPSAPAPTTAAHA